MKRAGIVPGASHQRHLASAETSIRQGRIIAIVRLTELTPTSARSLTEVLVASGVQALEFTLTTRNALRAITEARAAAGNQATVGAGTVLSEQQVTDAANAGAQFIVSPDVNTAVIQRTVQFGLLSVPGASTPTEVSAAVGAGAGLVKLFPAGPLGTEYFQAMRGPFPDVPFVPTGGISVDNVTPFLKAGAVAVALGSSLISTADDLSGLANRARQAVAAAAVSA